MELSVIKQGDRGIVVLLDDKMKIVKPVYAYLKQQARLDRSFNTIIANGRDLKLYWEFLNYMGYEYTEATLFTAQRSPFEPFSTYTTRLFGLSGNIS